MLEALGAQEMCASHPQLSGWNALNPARAAPCQPAKMALLTGWQMFE